MMNLSYWDISVSLNKHIRLGKVGCHLRHLCPNSKNIRVEAFAIQHMPSIDMVIWVSKVDLRHQECRNAIEQPVTILMVKIKKRYIRSKPQLNHNLSQPNTI